MDDLNDFVDKNDDLILQTLSCFCELSDSAETEN